MYSTRSLLFLPLLVSACSVPFVGGEARDTDAQCDEYAAQAIQAPRPDLARDLAARAAECYASLLR